MCYPKPGPRCSAHARAQLVRAQGAVVDAEPGTPAFHTAERDLEAAGRAWLGTPEGISAIEQAAARQDAARAADLRQMAARLRDRRREQLRDYRDAQAALLGNDPGAVMRRAEDSRQAQLVRAADEHVRRVEQALGQCETALAAARADLDASGRSVRRARAERDASMAAAGSTVHPVHLVDELVQRDAALEERWTVLRRRRDNLRAARRAAGVAAALAHALHESGVPVDAPALRLGDRGHVAALTCNDQGYWNVWLHERPDERGHGYVVQATEMWQTEPGTWECLFDNGRQVVVRTSGPASNDGSGDLILSPVQD